MFSTVASNEAAMRVRRALETAHFASQQGRPADAEWILREALAADPAHPDLLWMISGLAATSGRLAEAISFLRRLIAAQPGRLDARTQVIDLLMQLGRQDEALALIEAAPSEQQFDQALLNRRSVILADLGRVEERIALLDEWLGRVPRAVGLWKDRADALVTAGRRDEAIESLRHALTLDPAFGEVWWTLSNIKSLQLDDQDIRRMRKALKGRIDPAQAARIHFALGKVHEDRGDTDLAFRHYASANQLHAAGKGPLLGDIPAFAKRIRDLIPAGRKPAIGDPDASPIFIIGLHRAGSTLVEQILSTHSAVEGTRELDVVQHVFREAVARFGSESATIDALRNDDGTLAQEYGRKLIERAAPFRKTDRPMFIDKQPFNWILAPFIKLILPNAHLVDARRHPMACGFSNFRQFFPLGTLFTYSQESIGLYYRAYLDMMEAFDRDLPGAVHHVLNERLIEDPEREIRALFEYLGLDFDPAVMDFHTNRRAVFTPSAEQVRRPINRDGMHSWKPFEPHLGPLREALGDAIDRWDKV